MDILEGIKLLDDSVKLTERNRRIRNRYFDTVPELCVERARYYTESFRRTEHLPMGIRRAMAVAHVLENITIYLSPDELFAGGLAESSRGSSVFPEFSVKWIEEELNGIPCAFDQRVNDPYIVKPEVKRELLTDILPWWKGKTQEDRVFAMLPKETRIAGTDVKGFDGSWITMSGDGHTIPDFKKVLEVGINGIIKEAQEAMDKLDLSDPEDLRKRPFYQAVLIANQGILAYAGRLSKYAARLADQETDPVRKKELLVISQNCERVPAEPAETFYQGIQSILILHIAIQMESNGHGVSLGRFDQYLYPLFKKDLAAGRLTMEQALELVCGFYLKLNEMSKLRNVADTMFFVGYMIYPNLTIGGQKGIGKDAVNELSYICLAGTKKMKMIQPLLAVRLFPGTNERFLVECTKTIATGIGMPAFYNDDGIIPSLLNLGYELEDAYDYGITGCVEPSPQGKIGGRFGAAFPNPVKVLELALHGGTDPMTGITPLKGKGFAEVVSFDDFMAEFNIQQQYYLKHHVIQDNIIDLVWEEIMPTPILSSVISDCIARGKEIKQGGAKYDFTGGQMVGTASCINCLATIKKVVFDEKIISAGQLLHALDTNFEDGTSKPAGEEIRQILIRKGGAFGNDDSGTDEIASEFIRFWSINKTGYKNTRYGKGPIGGRFIPSTATVAANIPAGSVVGATPDGRKAGRPISEGISAFSGSDVKGPTALLNSVAAIPNIMYAGGQLLNVKFNPSSFAGDSGIRNFIALIRTYFLKKGFQIQVNVVNKETLREAQQHPEEYRDLMVRVAGYSAYFVTLNKQLQDDIIARTEHNMNS